MPYCQYCGTKLEDGQTCTCEMARTAANQQPYQPAQTPPQQEASQAAPSVKSRVAIGFEKFETYIASYISNPTQAVTSVLAEKSDFTLPIILTVIRMLAMGLAIYGLLSKLCKIMFTAITTSILRYGDSTSILTASLTASLSKSLIFGALIGAVCMLLFIAMLYALVKIQHGQITLSDSYKASAANGVPTSTLLLLSFLLSFISPGLSIACIALAMLAWIISGVRTAQIMSPNSSTGTFSLLYFVGVVLIIIAAYYMIPPLYKQAVGGITATYMGESIALQDVFDKIAESLKNDFAEEGISGWNDFFSGAMEHIFEEFSAGIWYDMSSMLK